jgi:hypothetical protein
MKFIRYLLLAGGLFSLVLGLGFVFQMPFALGSWPWPDGRYSYLFVGSILAAVSAAALWIGWTNDIGALPAGSLNLFVIELTAAIYFSVLIARDGRNELLVFAVVAFLLALLSGGFFLWSRRLDVNDRRPTPGFIRVCFGIFLVSLIFSGTALILRAPIFPWKLNPDTSVLFGCIFLGDAFYFLYALLYPRLSNAIGQLLSFLAYDLVLIVPFMKLFPTVDPAMRLNLIVYFAVLIFSAGVSIYYLFVHPQTRTWLTGSS